MVDLCLCTIVISAVQEGINLSNSAALSEPSSLQDYRTSSVSNVRSQPGGFLPMMANTGRLRPNGAPFFSLHVHERVGVSLAEVYIKGREICHFSV